MNSKKNSIQKDTWAGASHEQQKVMDLYEKLKSVLPHSTSSNDLSKIDKAFQLALSAHAGVRRKSGEPYIMHPLRVALIIAEEIGLGPTSIVSAIIHDIVEDTSVSINEVRTLFDLEVHRIVRGLTKIKKVFSWNRSMQAENFKKLFLSASEDNRIILIKLADRLDNMRYLDSLVRRKQLRISAETKHLYAPVAHRLGLNRVKAELEDLYLKYTHPKTYYEIAKKLVVTREERADKLATFATSIREALKKHKIKFEIQNRVKSIYSIWHKIVYNKIPFQEIYDLVALRIILDCGSTDEKAICWQTYGIISNMFSSNTNRLRDWISNPKLNGYESLHATMMSHSGEWIEIQIRTTRMHEIAERGVAAHWGYKRDIALGEGAKRLEKYLSEVRQLLEQGKMDSIHFIEDIKLGLYSDEIYVFSTKGTPILLPKGATVLDFAIEILEEKGLTCEGATINNRFVPINQVLKNGEQINLMLVPDQTVPYEWLNIPQTAKARRVIKYFFRKERLSMLQKGKKIIRDELKKEALSINKNIEIFLRDLLNQKSVEKTYYQVGSEAIPVNMVRKAITILIEIKKDQPDKVKKFISPIKLQIEKDIVVTGAGNSKYNLSSCCLPIPDEEIFGVLTINKEVIIHRVDCPHGIEILSTQGSRVVKARWRRNEKDFFLVGLRLKAHNRKGITKDIVNVVKVNVHIEALSFIEKDNYIEGNFTIEVENTKSLEKVIKMINEVKGVIFVERIGGQDHSLKEIN